MAIGLFENWKNTGLSNLFNGFKYTGGIPGTGTETDPLQLPEVSYTEKRNTMENNGGGILNASIWQSLFGNADDIITAIKSNPNQQNNWYNNGIPLPVGNNASISPVLLIGGVLVVIVIIVMIVMASRKK